MLVEKIEMAIEKCASRVAAQCPALDAMQIAQAAQSLSNTLATVISIRSADKPKKGAGA